MWLDHVLCVIFDFCHSVIFENKKSLPVTLGAGYYNAEKYYSKNKVVNLQDEHLIMKGFSYTTHSLTHAMLAIDKFRSQNYRLVMNNIIIKDMMDHTRYFL